MAQSHVKIVLPCQNEGEWLRVTVDSILENTAYDSFEVLILANGDTQTDFGFLDRRAYRHRVGLKRLKESLGVARSINEAVAPGDATHYAFLDAHCLVADSDWLHRVIDCLADYPLASMVQPEVLQFRFDEELRPRQSLSSEDVSPLGLAYSISWAWPYESPADIAQVESRPRQSSPYEAMAGGGMAVFTLAETFHRLGRYDAEVSGWFPETMDYCIGGWLRGRPMMVDPTIRVLHRVRPVSGVHLCDRYVNVIHGVLRTAYKYLSPRRRDLAELLFAKHGFHLEVDSVRQKIRQGRWLEERVAFLSQRVHADDWLFERFHVYEQTFGVRG